MLKLNTCRSTYLTYFLNVYFFSPKLPTTVNDQYYPAKFLWYYPAKFLWDPKRYMCEFPAGNPNFYLKADIQYNKHISYK